MTAKRLSRHCFGYLTIILGTMTAADGSAKFSINEHAVQIFKIVEDTAHAIKGVEIVMHPSYFNYLVPFTITVTCSDGTMDLSGMEHVHLEDSYMEAINETHSYIQAKFAVADISYRYDFCWLNFGVPVPIWLRGNILQSQYFVSATLQYKPQCQVEIQRAQLLTYGKLTVNIFQWMPGVIGEWLLDAITRNAQDQIFATVEKSIQSNTEDLTVTYNPCIVFPSMGKMAPHVPYPELDGTETTKASLDEPTYIGGLLDEMGETLRNSEYTPGNEGDIEGNDTVQYSEIEENETTPKSDGKIDKDTDTVKNEL